MAAPASTLFYGGSDILWLADPLIRENLNDLDTFEGAAISASESDLRPGMTLPGVSGSFVCESVTHRKLCATQWHHSVFAVGVAIGKAQRTIDESTTRVDEGFDTARAVVLTTNANAISLGTRFSTGDMYCVGVTPSRHPVYNGWHRVEALYKGTLGSKQIKMRCGTTAREISKDALSVTFPGGWSEPMKSELLLPRPTLTLSYVQNRVPTITIPMARRPATAPPVVVGYRFLTNPADVVAHWPNGWVLAAMNVDTIPGTQLSFVEEHYLFNEKFTF